MWRRKCSPVAAGSSECDVLQQLCVFVWIWTREHGHLEICILKDFGSSACLDHNSFLTKKKLNSLWQCQCQFYPFIKNPFLSVLHLWSIIFPQSAHAVHQIHLFLLLRHQFFKVYAIKLRVLQFMYISNWPFPARTYVYFFLWLNLKWHFTGTGWTIKYKCILKEFGRPHMQYYYRLFTSCLWILFSWAFFRC